jgi:hypothetical protein
MAIRFLAIVLALAATGCAGPTVSARWHEPVSARVELPTTTMAAGSSISGRVVIENRIGYALHGDGCLTPFQVVMSTDGIEYDAGWPLCLQRLTIPSGESSWPVTVVATYSGCIGDPGYRGNDLMPRCLANGTVPPLPPGTYRAKLVQNPDLVPTPPPVLIRVTP